jgi:hypothetical protein
MARIHYTYPLPTRKLIHTTPDGQTFTYILTTITVNCWLLEANHCPLVKQYASWQAFQNDWDQIRATLDVEHPLIEPVEPDPVDRTIKDLNRLSHYEGRDLFRVLEMIEMLSPLRATRVYKRSLSNGSYSLDLLWRYAQNELNIVRDRFMSKVDTESDPNGCWLWLGWINEGGYGGFGIGTRMVRAHRAAWMLFRGLIPPNMMVMHRCDNPPCVNPIHLSLGTHKENMEDRAQKGRTPKTWNRPTRQQILEIRELFATGAYTKTRIAEKFGMRVRTITDILLGKRYKKVK